MMQAILFDLDGVLYQDDRPIPGAAEVLAWVREQHIPHCFLTNTTSRPRSAIVAKLRAMGIAVAEQEVLTPPLAAAHWLRSAGRQRLALFATTTTADDFKGFTLVDDGGEVDAVVVGDLGEQWDFATMNRAFRLLMSETAPPLLALAMTRYWQSGTGLRLDAGPFIKALEYATGREAVVLGKPAAHYYQIALAQLGVTPQQTLMIGDDIRGDIEGAQRLGMKALLVRTGKFRPADLELGIQPAGVLDSIAELPRWWRDYSGNGSSPAQAL
ncbi:MAG TPA: TIGR01458 family HAD-type hydrolase [Gammaproteobacteria bacterium]